MVREPAGLLPFRSVALLLALLEAAGFLSPLPAQDFTDDVRQYVGENARSFLSPLADGLIADVNSGLNVTGPGAGLHAEIQLVVMGAIMPDSKKTFVPLPFEQTVEFTYAGLPFLGDLSIHAPEMPTAVGLGKEYSFSGRLTRIRPKGAPYVGAFDFIQKDTTVTIGGLGDLPLVPFGTPQIAVGGLFGTSVTFRALPWISIGKMGSVSMLGIGVEHDVANELPLPIGLSVAAAYQSARLRSRDPQTGLDVEISSLLFRVTAFREFRAGVFQFMPYASVGGGPASIDLGYHFADPYVGQQHISFTGDTGVRGAFGVSVRVLMVDVHFDIAMAATTSLSAGVGVIPF